MHSFKEYLGVATITILSSVIISACQPKAAQTAKGIEAYLVENPYHEQSESDQVKSLAALASLLNKVAPLQNDEKVKLNFKFDANKDAVVIHSIVQHNLTTLQLKKLQETYAKMSNKRRICNSGEPKAVASLYGIGTETIIRDLSGEFVAKITCPSMTAETYALRKFLAEKPYKEQSESEQAKTLRILTEALNSYEIEIGNPNPSVYKADISRDMIMAYNFDRKIRSEREFKAYKALFNKGIASQREAARVRLCKLGDIEAITSLGISYQATLLDTKDRIIYKFEVCHPELSTSKLRG